MSVTTVAAGPRHRGRKPAQRPHPRLGEQERRPADPRRVPAGRRAGDALERPAHPRRRDDARARSARRARAPSGPARTRCASTRRGSRPPRSTRVLAERIRASFLLAGPLLARLGRASVPPPGGDVIGRRRLDPHIHALERLGAQHRDREPLRDADRRPARRRDLPRRGERDGDRERGDGRRPRARRDHDRERRLRAARAGSLPLPRLARRRDRGHRVERPPDPRRREAARRRVGDRARAHRGRQLHRPRRRHEQRPHDRRRRAAATWSRSSPRSSGSGSRSSSETTGCACRRTRSS